MSNTFDHASIAREAVDERAAIQMKRRFAHAVVMPVAEQLRQILLPSCERIEIAGSLRRQQPDVGDIELLCIPKTIVTPGGLLGMFTTSENALDTAVMVLLGQEFLNYRLNSKGAKIYGSLNKLLVHVESGIPVDIFSTTIKNWGMALVVRTGPKEFNIRMMARFRQEGMRGHAYGGVTDGDGQEIGCPDEATVFRQLGWLYQEPVARM